jgi:hypothetical protein
MGMMRTEVSHDKTPRKTREGGGRWRKMAESGAPMQGSKLMCKSTCGEWRAGTFGG